MQAARELHAYPQPRPSFGAERSGQVRGGRADAPTDAGADGEGA